jgi:hypothetical protein
MQFYFWDDFGTVVHQTLLPMTLEADPSANEDARLRALWLAGDYHAYLVRLWRETPEMPWRVLVREALTGRETHFADLDELAHFFQRVADGHS